MSNSSTTLDEKQQLADQRILRTCQDAMVGMPELQIGVPHFPEKVAKIKRLAVMELITWLDAHPDRFVEIVRNEYAFRLLEQMYQMGFMEDLPIKRAWNKVLESNIHLLHCEFDTVETVETLCRMIVNQGNHEAVLKCARTEVKQIQETRRFDQTNQEKLTALLAAFTCPGHFFNTLIPFYAELGSMLATICKPTTTTTMTPTTPTTTITRAQNDAKDNVKDDVKDQAYQLTGGLMQEHVAQFSMQIGKLLFYGLTWKLPSNEMMNGNKAPLTFEDYKTVLQLIRQLQQPQDCYQRVNTAILLGLPLNAIKEQLFQQGLIHPAHNKTQPKDPIQCIDQRLPSAASCLRELYEKDHNSNIAHSNRTCCCYCACSQCWHTVCSVSQWYN